MTQTLEQTSKPRIVVDKILVFTTRPYHANYYKELNKLQ